jgi:ABC-2 type transport system ATP-binding protein
MLRAGRIIETGRLDVLRGLAALHVRVVLDGTPPDVAGFAGITNVVAHDDVLECDVAGSMEPLMRALVDVGIRHLTTREPSLEELFVAHYGTAAEPSSVGP